MRDEQSQKQNRDRHLPCCVTLDGSDSSVGDDDDFAHDGDDGDHFWFAVLDEAFEEGAPGWVVVSCSHGGHEEDAFEACAPAPDGPSAPRDSAVARMRGAAVEASGGASIDTAEFGHAGLEDEGGLTSNAGNQGERVEAGLEAGIGRRRFLRRGPRGRRFRCSRLRARRRPSGRASGRRKGAGGSDWSRPRA
jgi:hypothetical protein